MTLPEQSVSARLSGQENNDKCASMKVLEERIKENPGLAKKLESIEAQTQRFAANWKNGTGSGKPGGGTGGGTSTSYAGTVTTPMYVPYHLPYQCPQQNITETQMFTTRQKTRIPALFASDGARSNFVITP